MTDPLCSVLVPYRPDGGYRDVAWDWIRRRWAALLPECEIIVSSDDGGADPGQFNHPLAINRCAERASSDVLIIADADTAFEPGWVRNACDSVRLGIPWVLPTFYDKLTQDQTANLLTAPCDITIPAELDLEWRGENVANSGLVVIPRAGFTEVGGYDERWASWGSDDAAMRITLDALWGPVERLPGRCIHCWHPAPVEQTYGHADHDRQAALMARYVAAGSDPAAVWAVRFG